MRIEALALTCVGLWACGDDGGKPVDAAPDDMQIDDAPDAPSDANLMPMTLQETGLCNDGPCMTINPGVFAFTPQYQLFSDSATKKRWLYLPPGTQIDTSDMNYWKFPVGTKVWKEFTSGTTRVETRFIMKVDADDSAQASWFWASYIWDTANTTATYYDPAIGMPDANGTTHDVPSRSQCRRCHQNTPGRILGVNAMSLDYTATEGLDLQDLVDMNLLSTPPTAGAPFFPLPNPTNVVEKAAYGFFHANCGGCHNPTSTVHDTVNIDLRLDVTKLATVGVMPAHATTVNVTAQLSTVPGIIILPNNTTDSVLMQRLLSLQAGVKMPELGTETVNTDGVAAVTAWINQPP